MFFKKYKKILVIVFFLLVGAGCLVFFQSVKAQNVAEETSPLNVGVKIIEQPLGLPVTDIRLVVARIIRAVLGLLGIIALGLVLYGGFTWMTAGGNEEKISAAKKILLNAGIGLIIILSSYAIVSFVISKLIVATTGLPEHCSNSVQDAGETGVDCGGECSACIGVNPYLPGGLFYVNSLPAGGIVCIRNVHPVVVFNLDVDLDSLQGNAVVQKKDDGTTVAGRWTFGTKNNMAIFTPEGSCLPDDGGNDCLVATTTYRLVFNNPSDIKSLGSQLSLNCSIKAGCGPVEFTTGAGVDRQPPVVTFLSPSPSTPLQAGTAIPIKIGLSDDNGVQSAALYERDYLIGSQSFSGCQRNVTADMVWPTAGLTHDTYTLQALGMDWSAAQGSATINLTLRPAHCFDNILDRDLGEIEAGPPACGGACGACAGDKCTGNDQCASGYCEIPQGATDGVCVDKMRIESVSPLSGAVGTYVSLFGFYFGESGGHVYFAKTDNPEANRLSDWVEAPLVNCGPGFDNWTSRQIIVELPALTVSSSPIQVITASTTGKDNVVRQFSDITNDNWGPKINDFQVTNEVRPGLCGINPPSAPPGTKVQLVGKNFGLLGGANDQVLFGQSRAPVSPIDWFPNLIRAAVPSLEGGVVGVKVIKNGLESNGLRFTVTTGVGAEAPFLTGISPAQGAKGDYLTITGKNFGANLGAVWFKAAPGSTAIMGDFLFPKDCQNSVWRDDQIIVKFPLDTGEVDTNYYVQVNTADNKTSAFDSNFQFSLESGAPSPGICKISPISGLVPFVPDVTMAISGEYFGTQPDVYFWQVAASSTAINGRVAADKQDSFSATDNLINARPPASTESGPVVVYRSLDKKMSNPLSFSVLDCVKNASSACNLPNFHCCAAGAESGFCKPDVELCAGQTRSAGYIWRFSTKDIPFIPHVVERCDAATDEGKNLPTPSPNIMWMKNSTSTDDQYNVCRTALAEVAFNTLMDQKTISGSSVLINRCSGVDSNNCLNPTLVALTPESYHLKISNGQGGGKIESYLELQPNDRQWPDNTWYQVVLMSAIKSAGTVTSSMNLAADKPCNAANSAYCFVFKTDAKGCVMKAVVITPYTFWTQVLEAPIQYHASNGDVFPLYYNGNGLSDQHCIMMDVSGFDWSWKTGDKDYALIYGPNGIRSVQASALANTVGVGLANPDNAVNIDATASTGTISYAGHSPLTIDLSDPEVVDYWPNCLEACTNAEVGARFNTTMSNRNLPGAIESGTVQLLKCKDENCLNTQSVLSLGDVMLDPVSHYTVLDLANSHIDSTELSPNTIYQVILSAESANPAGATNQLWSAAKLGDPNTFSKPYNKVFTWRFRTKKEKCKIDRVEVTPSTFYARSLKDRSIYEAQPRGAPDACDPKGQKLNPWSVSWTWTSSAESVVTAESVAAGEKVATVASFSSRGQNRFCTPACLRKGSDVPVGASVVLPVCGNSKVEAGEDCDPPSFSFGCGLDCRHPGNPNFSATPTTTANYCGNGIVEPSAGEVCDIADAATKDGCGRNCLHLGSKQTTGATEVGASICGNGFIGSGEDCDLGIPSNPLSPNSSMDCSEKCLHTGRPLSTKWCFEHSLDRGGFSAAEYDAACAAAISQCGDKVENPDEDPGCDNALTGWDDANCNEYCLKKTDTECVASSEGCDEFGRHIGSSLLYSVPSVCGDGTGGIGEDAFCETGLSTFHQGLIDPWALAVGVGLGEPSGDPPAQRTNVSAETDQQTRGGPVSGSGKFIIPCGYKTDAECQSAYNSNDYGVGKDSCCYKNPTLTRVYPGSLTDIKDNVCPNTAIEADFNGNIDPKTLPGNLFIARGGVDSDFTPVCAGENDFTILLASSLLPDNYSTLPWYKKAYYQVIKFIKEYLGNTVFATIYTQPARWCAGGDLGTSDVIKISSTASRITVSLSKALSFESNYAIVLKPGIKDRRGVSIGKNIIWKFNTAKQICEVKSVAVIPDQLYFSRVNALKSVLALAATDHGALIQPIVGYYDWAYIWGPMINPYVIPEKAISTFSNTIKAQNRNGEVDIGASANIMTNVYSATPLGIAATGRTHATVFLCENPWPPKDLYYKGSGPFTIFPYEDILGNNDGFDMASNTFNNTAIPQAEAALPDGYFNFRIYYCADAGSPGTFDDLPYLRPTVQTSTAILSTGNGRCAFTGDICQVNDDCGKQFEIGNYKFYIPIAASGVCGGTTSTVPAERYFTDANGQPLVCLTDFDCMPQQNAFSKWAQDNKYTHQQCFTVGVSAPINCYLYPPLKRFLFTNNKNSDVIGIQIFPNPKHLTASEWYERDRALGGQGFSGGTQRISIDGYEAISDGNNIYVDALNYSISTMYLYTNIYLFSVNADAQPETRKVFDQIMMSNLKFNVNLVNYGYCGADMNNPGSDTTCKNDLDCPAGQICSATVDKLKRNYQRLRGLDQIQNLLGL